MAMVRIFEVMLGQTLNYCVWNYVICTVSHLCKLFNLLNQVSKVGGLVLSISSCFLSVFEERLRSNDDSLCDSLYGPV
jgi:hypothetical protein